jgi:hypothetical protein
MNLKERERRLRRAQELEEQQRQLFHMTPEARAVHDKPQIKKSLAWNEYLRRVHGPGKPQRGDDEYPPWSLSDHPRLTLLPGEEFPRNPWNIKPRSFSTEQQPSAAASDSEMSLGAIIHRNR